MNATSFSTTEDRLERRASAVYRQGCFTLDGGELLERRLSGACKNVVSGVRRIIADGKLEGLMLGGGYGRGEGGVLETPLGQRPYNDLDFYILVRGNRWLNERHYHVALHRLGHEIAQFVGAEVEFKIISLAEIRRSPPSMFYYDLMMGHRWLWGAPDQLEECKHHRLAPNIPLAEATRLLLNRGTGLFLAREVLSRRPLAESDEDFVGRNLAKAQLAFGDVVLTAFKRYHWSCRTRHARLGRLNPNESLPWLDEVCFHHAQGVEFKLHPHRANNSPSQLQGRLDGIIALGRQLWLWLESRRLEHQFDSTREYALSPINKCPETNPLRNILVNLKMFGPCVQGWKCAKRNPRERLLHALAILLWECPPYDSKFTRQLQMDLQINTAARPEFCRAYQALSARINGTASPL